MEDACDAMGAYADALIAWVQETRSTTLIPLQIFYKDAIVAKQDHSGIPGSHCDTEALAYSDKRIQCLQSKLSAVRARWEGCDRVRQQLDQSWRTHRTRTEAEWQARNIVSNCPEKVAAERVGDFHPGTNKVGLTKKAFPVS
jgi:hypothetical protein